MEEVWKQALDDEEWKYVNDYIFVFTVASMRL